MSRRARHPAARMGARAAHIKPLGRSAVTRMAQHRPCRPQLVQRHRAMHDVATHHPELPLKVQRRQYVPGDHGCSKAGRISVHRRDHIIRRLPPRRVPASAIGQLWRELLAEQARHMASRRRQTVVDDRRDQHLDDRRG